MLLFKVSLFVLCLVIASAVSSKSFDISYRSSHVKTVHTTDINCNDWFDSFEPKLKDTIKSYQPKVNEIIDFIVNGDFKGKTYKEVEDFVDLFPSRPSGYQSLEESIDYMMDRMRNYSLDNVRGEQVTVPHWVRGEEKAELLEPIRKDLPILGLGSSIGTPEEGITAPILVVRNFLELDQKQDEAHGKIVVFNQGWINESYGDTVAYRINGASHAARYGAVAALVESPAPFSLNTPHTGLNIYSNGVVQIPVASITKEDADLLYRLQVKNNRTCQIRLRMMDYNLPMTTSRNVIGEIEGAITPTEYVCVSGHIDSWDVGQGAMDDAGGVLISVMALAALKELNLTPNRTLQAILWTGEEMSMWGAKGFVEQHKSILANYSVVFESDFGTFAPRGLDFAGKEGAGCIVQEVLKLMEGINATEYARYDTVSSDITLLQAEGVPGLNLNNHNDKYFWYHHTAADTMSMMNSTELDLDTALWAAASYVLADIPIMLPKD